MATPIQHIMVKLGVCYLTYLSLGAAHVAEKKQQLR